MYKSDSREDLSLVIKAHHQALPIQRSSIKQSDAAVLIIIHLSIQQTTEHIVLLTASATDPLTGKL